MQTETITADQAADYVLWSAYQSGSFTSNLKLQKLVYYIQAWHLAVYKRPLFPEKFEAWIHGPAIPDLYRRFKVHTWNHIKETIARPDISDGTAAFMDEVLDQYGGMDALELELSSQHEPPWKRARGEVKIDEACHTIISEVTMGRHYRKRMSDEQIAEFIALEREARKEEEVW